MVKYMVTMQGAPDYPGDVVIELIQDPVRQELLFGKINKFHLYDGFITGWIGDNKQVTFINYLDELKAAVTALMEVE